MKSSFEKWHNGVETLKSSSAYKSHFNILQRDKLKKLSLSASQMLHSWSSSSIQNVLDLFLILTESIESVFDLGEYSCQVRILNWLENVS